MTTTVTTTQKSAFPGRGREVVSSFGTDALSPSRFVDKQKKEKRKNRTVERRNHTYFLGPREKEVLSLSLSLRASFLFLNAVFFTLSSHTPNTHTHIRKKKKMAPNKKGGKGKGESKTGAAVRVLDDDDEDKIQARNQRESFLLSLLTLSRG